MRDIRHARLLFNFMEAFDFKIPKGQPATINMTTTYAKLSKRYDIRFDEDLETDLETLHQCTCTQADEAVAFFPVVYTNIRENWPNKAHLEDTAARCATAIRKSCSRTTEQTLDGKIIGILGVQ